MDNRSILGSIAVVLGFVAIIPYIRDILKKKTRPHSFTWLVWSLITAISYFAQLSDGAGPGSWVMGFSSALCFGIFLLSLKYGEKNIVLIDWIALCGALIALVSWIIADTALYAAILITITDVLATFITLRKSYYKPYQETLSNYTISAFKHVLSVSALTNFSIITALYPLFLIAANTTLSLVIIMRRKIIRAPASFTARK